MHTLSSAARAVGIAKSTIYRAVKTGRLPAYMLKGGTYAIYPGDLRRVFPSIFEPQDEQQSGDPGFPIWDVS
ncbi:MAG: excisionase family DNA-binding protein [Xanthobacteraceae bacterium]